jgi:hypothetical protein
MRTDNTLLGIKKLEIEKKEYGFDSLI